MGRAGAAHGASSAQVTDSTRLGPNSGRGRAILWPPMRRRGSQRTEELAPGIRFASPRAMATATTTEPYPVTRKILPGRISRALEVARTHIAMFGYISAARA